MTQSAWEPLPSNPQILRRSMSKLEFRVFLNDDRRWAFTARGKGEYVYRAGCISLRQLACWCYGCR
jgi:hypothetical protein